MKDSATLELDQIGISFNGKQVVSNLDLTVRQGELVSLLGPSGCGKSTTLRLIGGFLTPETGVIRLGGKRIDHIPPEQRSISTVFQSYALFPHMSVLENVMYGLSCHRVPKKTAREQAMSMLATVGLSAHADQNVTRLSGGQQQRVALARVLVLNPEVLLLDEPFSNLDAALRLQMREEVRQLQRGLGLTTLFVTHDHEEAMALSDRIAVMQSGRIAQIDTPRTIYASPANRYVAECVGRVNTVKVNGKEALIRPEHILLSRNSGGHEGRIISAVYLGMLTRLQIDLEGQSLIVDDLSSTVDETYIAGDTVYLTFTRFLNI